MNVHWTRAVAAVGVMGGVIAAVLTVPKPASTPVPAAVATADTPRTLTSTIQDLDAEAATLRQTISTTRLALADSSVTAPTTPSTVAGKVTPTLAAEFASKTAQLASQAATLAQLTRALAAKTVSLAAKTQQLATYAAQLAALGQQLANEQAQLQAEANALATTTTNAAPTTTTAPPTTTTTHCDDDCGTDHARG